MVLGESSIGFNDFHIFRILYLTEMLILLHVNFT